MGTFLSLLIMLSRVFASTVTRRFSTAAVARAEDPMASGPKDIPEKLKLTLSTPDKAVFEKEESGPVEQYFVPTGMAVMNDDSTLNITAPEAVAIDDIDPEAARAALAEFTAAFSSASTDEDRARAQIGAELYGTMVNAATMDVFA